MGYRYAIIGSGRQGLSAAYDLGRFGEAEEIRLYDLDGRAAQLGAERLNRLLDAKLFNGFSLDARDEEGVANALNNVDSAISAAPYALNLGVTRAAIRARSNLCDLGGHTDTVREQLKLDAKSAGVTVTPDCGMGPGLNVSMAVLAMSLVDQPDEVFIWDGGLPQNPQPPWNYQSTFNLNGLANEYDGEAYFIRNGEVAAVPALTELERLEFPEPLGELEAMVTSGGLSTAPWTFEGKLKTLENKTLRYPGHWREFCAFKELGLFGEEPVQLGERKVIPREFFHKLLGPKIQTGPVEDICVIRILCKGTGEGENVSCTLDLAETYDEATGFTAMEKLTGWHASIIAIMGAKGELPKGGVPVELALAGEKLTQEAARRGWSIKKAPKTIPKTPNLSNQIKPGPKFKK